MASNICDLYPLINGEPSKLYKDLLDLVDNDRKLANYIYAAYLQQGVAAQMDSNFSRNNQNQHNAKDVYKFLGIDELRADQDEIITPTLKRAGAIDKDGNRISYKDGKQALEMADRFNDSDSSFVATVWQHEDEFQIYVEKIDSGSIEGVGKTKEQLKAWEVINQVFNAKGIDLNALATSYPNIFSPVNIPDTISWLRNLQSMNPSYISLLSLRDLEVALTFNANNPTVQRLISKYGSIKDVAAEFSNYLNTGNASHADALRFDQVRNILLTLGGIDTTALSNQIDTIGTSLRATESSFLIADTIKSFGDKINANIIRPSKRQNERITSLSEAALKAVEILSRKLEDAKESSDDRQALEVDKKLSKIISQIEGKCYYGGTLELIQSVNTDIIDLLNAIQNPTGGTSLERLIEFSNNYRKLKDITENYMDILQALSDLEKVIINENISKADEQSLQNEASEALSKLLEVKEMIDSTKVHMAVDILKEYLGDTDYNGLAITELAIQSMSDTHMLDMLFSMTDISSPMVSAVGTIIRRAQQERDKKAVEIDNRIQRATNRLNKAGHSNEEWMYEPDGTIISDIDWSAYFKARAQYKRQLEAQGYKGYTFDRMVMDWEDQHTEDRVVDKVSGRTERVPDKTFRKAMPVLDAAQQEYYDTMMQIKGELGTMLPAYARDHYTPPQIRQDFWAQLKDAYKNYPGKSKAKRIFKILTEKFKDLFVFREDEDFVDSRGYFHGDYSSVPINPDGTMRKRIPAYYRTTLKDPSMLDKNFSYALAKMASTAINYDSLHKIENMVIFMKDFIHDKDVAGKDSSGRKQVNIIEKKGTLISRNIAKLKYAASLHGTLEGIIDGQMYGMVEYRKTWYNKMIINLIKYTSTSSLAVNVKGAVSNKLVGNIQTMIEATGGEFYGWKDLAKAWAEHSNPKEAIEVVADIMNGTKLSLNTLLNERFNVQQKVFSQLKDKHYYTSRTERLGESVNTLLLYELGEYSTHQLNLKAILYSEKVLLNGKKVPLKEVFDKTQPVDGVSELTIKPGATQLDGSPITEEYLDRVMNIVKLVNQEHHGAMNEEDKGTLHRFMLGKMVMTFRQWMVKHYSRRFKKAERDKLTGLEREGFHRATILMAFAQIMQYKGLRKLGIKIFGGDKFADKLDHLQGVYLYKNIKARGDRMRQAAWKKAIAEYAIAGILSGLWHLLGGDDDDEDRSWSEYQALGMIDRLLLDVLGSTPYGVFGQSEQLINKPIPSINTLNNVVYPFAGIGDMTEDYKTGRYTGENKYWHNMRYTFLPFYKQIDYFINPEDDNSRLVKR